MRTIPLTRGLVALVDDEDYERLAGRKWRAVMTRYTYYAVSGQWPKLVHMHREVLLPTEGVLVDHIDGDGLNNRRGNLRPANFSQNGCNRGQQRNNTSGYKGVSWDSHRQKWRTQIMRDGRTVRLGDFDTPEEAATAVRAARPSIHGQFACNEER